MYSKSIHWKSIQWGNCHNNMYTRSSYHFSSQWFNVLRSIAEHRAVMNAHIHVDRHPTAALHAHFYNWQTSPLIKQEINHQTLLQTSFKVFEVNSTCVLYDSSIHHTNKYIKVLSSVQNKLEHHWENFPKRSVHIKRDMQLPPLISSKPRQQLIFILFFCSTESLHSEHVAACESFMFCFTLLVYMATQDQ